MPVNKPETTGLAAALGEFLQGTLQPQLSGKDAYDARVAASVLSIIKRELEQGEQLRAGELQGLKQLLGQEGTRPELNALLCERIRSGAIDYRDAGLMDFLRQTSLARLAIDNPNYSAYKRATT